MSENTYPQCVLDVCKALPISLGQLEVSIATPVRQVWDLIACIGKQNKLVDSLTEMDVNTFKLKEVNTHFFQFEKSVKELIQRSPASTNPQYELQWGGTNLFAGCLEKCSCLR